MIPFGIGYAEVKELKKLEYLSIVSSVIILIIIFILLVLFNKIISGLLDGTISAVFYLVSILLALYATYRLTKQIKYTWYAIKLLTGNNFCTYKVQVKKKKASGLKFQVDFEENLTKADFCDLYPDGCEECGEEVREDCLERFNQMKDSIKDHYTVPVNYQTYKSVKKNDFILVVEFPNMTYHTFPFSKIDPKLAN